MKEFKSLLTNYKTSLPAFLGLVCVGLYFFDVIDKDQLTVGIGAFVSIGLLGAKDHTK